MALPVADAPLTGAAALSPAQVFDELDRTEAEWCRRSLRLFVEKAWSLVEPSTPFVPNWHIDLLCDVLTQVTEGTLKRLIINIPPGTSKSLVVSVFWPVWEWATTPERRYLTASYGSHLTTRDNLRVRDILESEWYRTQFPALAFEPDQNQKTRFNTTAGGWRIASSVGGVGTGEHPDRIIIDDPLTADQARSDIERERVNRWFDRTIASRGVSRDTAIVVVMQRLHEDDLSGHLLAREGWTHLCLPMRYETHRPNQPEWRPDPRDIRTRPGELLWPDLFTEEKVRQLEIDLGPYGTAGQLQQRPAPEGGGQFQRAWFKFVEAVPINARRVRAWDTAATEENAQGQGDYTVGVRMSEKGGAYYLEQVIRVKAGPAGVDALMKAQAQIDGKRCAIRELREPGASGKSTIAAHTVMLAGYDYAEHRVSSDKVSEARPFRAQCEAGNVYILRTGDATRDAWIEPYLDEVTAFPTGKHDDQVDGSSCAFNTILVLPQPATVAPMGVGTAPSYWNGPQ